MANKNVAKNPVKSAKISLGKSARMGQSKSVPKYPRRSVRPFTFAKYAHGPHILVEDNHQRATIPITSIPHSPFDRAFPKTISQSFYTDILSCYSKSMSSTPWLNVLIFGTKIAIASIHNIKILAKYKFKQTKTTKK